MAFMPIVGDKIVNPTIRIAISFYITVFLFPMVDYHHLNVTSDTFILALLSEMTLGLVSAMLVKIVFLAVQISGDLIGYAAGLSMANMFDPASGTQQGVISRLLYYIVLVVYLESGMFEVTLYMLGTSFDRISLGTFNLYDYDGMMFAVNEVKTMFAFAFSFALPLFFVAFIMDVYYGYGTKSMPSFSPFVITFQIKFTLIFIFMMLGLEVFTNSFIAYFTAKLQ